MKALKLIINQKFRPDMSDDEVYEVTRGDWVIGDNRRQEAQYAMAVGDGKVRGLYKIDKWEPVSHDGQIRWRFTGKPADEPLRGECVGKHKRNLRGDASPVDLIDLDVFRYFGHDIEKKHIIQAFNYIAEKGDVRNHDIHYVFRPARKKSVIYNEKKYAAKEVMRIAYCYKIGEKPAEDNGKFSESQWRLFSRNSASWTTNMATDFLRKLEFEIFSAPEDDSVAEQEKPPMKSWELKLLEQFYQIILYGPPGTGKTYTAKKILSELFDEDDLEDLQGENWDIVQFHPSYNYEDFVRGIQAKTTKSGQVTYETDNRVFGNLCMHASYNPNAKYALIIDEINRADVSAVLGELIYALEYRGERVRTPYLGDIIIPPNLYIIGTMNTADRTIGQIDYAVRRRFAFVSCPPERDVIEQQFPDALDVYDETQSLFDEINGDMSSDFNADDVRIGHSYFMAEGRALDNQIKYKVIPILREYVKNGVLKSAASQKIDKIQDDIDNLYISEQLDAGAEKTEAHDDPHVLTVAQQRQWRKMGETARRQLERQDLDHDEILKKLNFLKNRIAEKVEIFGALNVNDLLATRKNRLSFCWKHQSNGSSGSAGVGRTALGIIQDFIAQHPKLTAEELAEEFKDIELGNHKRIELLENISEPHRYFSNESDHVILDNGTTVCISREWGATGQSERQWDKFTSHMKQYGYSICLKSQE